MPQPKSLTGWPPEDTMIPVRLDPTRPPEWLVGPPQPLFIKSTTTRGRNKQTPHLNAELASSCYSWLAPLCQALTIHTIIVHRYSRSDVSRLAATLDAMPLGHHVRPCRQGWQCSIHFAEELNPFALLPLPDVFDRIEAIGKEVHWLSKSSVSAIHFATNYVRWHDPPRVLKLAACVAVPNSWLRCDYDQDGQTLTGLTYMSAKVSRIPSGRPMPRRFQDRRFVPGRKNRVLVFYSLDARAESMSSRQGPSPTRLTEGQIRVESRQANPYLRVALGTVPSLERVLANVPDLMRRAVGFARYHIDANIITAPPVPQL